MVPVPQAARDAAESLRIAPNSVVSEVPRRRRESLTVPVPPALPLLPEGSLKRSIWVSITVPWYKHASYNPKRGPVINALQLIPGPSMKQPQELVTLSEYGVAHAQHKTQEPH